MSLYQYLSNTLSCSSCHEVWLRILVLGVCLGFGVPAVALQRIDEKTLAYAEKTGACFYQKATYDGHVACYVLPDHDTAGRAELPKHLKNDVTAIRLYGQAAVTAYDKPQQSGRHVRLLANVWNMDFLNDSVESVRLQRRRANHFACFFEHPGYGGTAHCVDGNSQQTSFRSLNDTFSSVIIGGRATVTVYDREHYSGHHQMLERSYHALAAVGWDNRIRAANVSPRPPYDWETALDLQYALGDAVSIYLQHHLGSHNTYNSSAYLTNLFLGHNQSRSIYEQLELGVREFELDAHGRNHHAYFCHSIDCGVHRVNARRVLSEIKTFVDAHPEAFLLIRLQDNMHKATYDSLGASLQRIFGNRLFTPQEVFPHHHACSQGGARVPPNITLADLKAAGKQLLIWGIRCHHAGADRLSDVVWVRSASEPDSHKDFATDCNDVRADRFVRVVEADNRFADKTVPNRQIPSALRCGVNAIAMDHIGPLYGRRYGVNSDNTRQEWTGRLGLQLWTWRAANDPSAGPCTFTRPTGVEGHNEHGLATFLSASCDHAKAYVCKQEQRWFVSTATGNWSGGHSGCGVEHADFAVPRTPVEVYEMIQAVLDSAVPEAWVHYRQPESTSP